MKFLQNCYLVILFFVFSCSKDNSEQSPNTQQLPNWYAYYNYKGAVIDSSLFGIIKLVPGQKVYTTAAQSYNYQGTGIYYYNNSQTSITDQNGIFADTFSVYTKMYGGVVPNLVGFASSFTDTLAGFQRFTLNELDSHNFHVNIYLTSIGYLQIHLIDTTHTESVWVNFDNAAQLNDSWAYYPDSNGYADTTVLIKVFKNSMVHITTARGIIQMYDSAFVPAHDTIKKDIYY